MGFVLIVFGILNYLKGSLDEKAREKGRKGASLRRPVSYTYSDPRNITGIHPLYNLDLFFSPQVRSGPARIARR